MDGALSLLSSAIDKLFPNKDERDKHKVKLLELEQAGEFKEHELRYEAIVAEAKSQDAWTSRARPSFMYVFYIILLSAIPFSITYAISPETGEAIAVGLKSYYNAIPQELYSVFGVGYVGYSAARSYDKRQVLDKKEKFSFKNLFNK